MYTHIRIYVYIYVGTLISGFWLCNYSFVPGRSPEPKIQIFRLWKLNLPDREDSRLISIFVFLVRTSSFPEIFRNTHDGKDTEREWFVLENVWCTKAKTFKPDRKNISVRNRIFFYNIGIDREEAFHFENPCSEHLPLYLWVHQKANFTGVICHPNRLSTYPTEIYDPSKPIFTTSQKFH